MAMAGLMKNYAGNGLFDFARPDPVFPYQQTEYLSDFMVQE
jgi:hypothetical protein